MPGNGLSPPFPLAVGEISSCTLSQMVSEGHFQIELTDVAGRSSEKTRLVRKSTLVRFCVEYYHV